MKNFFIFISNVLKIVKKIYVALFPKYYVYFNRKKINLGEEKIFIGVQADRIKDRLRNDFILTGKTFPGVGSSNSETDVSINVKQIVCELNNKGFFLIENYLSHEVCKQVVDHALKTPCFPRSMDYGLTIPKVEKINFDGPHLSARYDFSPNMLSIFESQDLQNLISDSFLHEIAEKYLLSKPYLDPIDLWWFLPFPTRDDAWAEEYHFDFDSVRWLKFFFNFEDIELENGPHCFIEGTHKDFGIPENLRKRGYMRHSDEEVFKYIDRSHERKFTAKAGSLLIEDTRGLHKGLTPTAGRRLLFSFQLSNYLFIEQASINSRFKPDFVMSDSFHSLWQKSPEFFSRYFV